MITGLIQPKKWKKFFALALAGAVAAVGTTCVVLRAVPNFSERLDATALIAAGFILPSGAAQALLEDTGDHTEEEALSASSQEEQAAVSSAEEPEAASSAVPEPEESSEGSDVSQASWSGKAYPILELTLENSGLQYGAVFVKNTNDYTEIDIETELAREPDLSIQKDGTPQVLLYHTHTTESYMTEEGDTYYSDMPTRTTDEDANVIAVGNAIAAKLEAAGIGVIHDTTIHDKSYNGSYTRSAETVSAYLEEYPTIQVTLDIHRDAMTAEDGTRYKPTVEINGKKAAQVMLICGCDDDGTLGFPDWEYNLRLAVRLQRACAAISGNFARPLSFCPRNYNENLTHNSLLLEVGTEVNTVEEAAYSGALFGGALAEVLEQFVN